MIENWFCKWRRIGSYMKIFINILDGCCLIDVRSFIVIMDFGILCFIMYFI